MNAKNPNLTFDSQIHDADGTCTAPTAADRHVRPWVNWGLALSTVPAAAIVMLFALGAVMSTDGCSDRSCPNLGHGGIDFGVAFYGAPVVAFVVLVALVFHRQAPRRHRGAAVRLGAVGRRRRAHGATVAS